MREIKFRCFNKHSMVMHPWAQLVQLNKIHLLDEQKGSYPVMQFTGLKDINGVDIYEGDIVESDFYMPHIKETCVIKYEPSLMRFVFDGGEQDAFEYGNLTVIGNIYENPELLN